MKLCKNCGKELTDDVKFCPDCGAPASEDVNSDESKNIAMGRSSFSSGAAGGNSADLGNGYGGFSPMPGQQDTAPMPMKWYKFLIYFLLYATAVLNLISSLSIFVELSTHADEYALFPGAMIVDILSACMGIGFTVFAFYTRFMLAEYKKKGPACVYIMYGASAAYTLVFGILSVIVTNGVAHFGTSNVTSILTNIAMIAANYIYFKKRQDYFVN